MPQCPFCDLRYTPGQTHCQGCGAELPALTGPPAPAGQEVGSPDAAASANLADLPPLEANVLRVLGAEGKIAAIKVYREATGRGLRESKEAVEALARARGVVPASGNAGCTTVLFAIFATLCLAVSCIVASLGRWPW